MGREKQIGLKRMSPKEKIDSMKLFLASISLIILIITSGCTDDFKPKMFRSIAKYTVDVQSNGPVENVTFIIPLPVKNGTPMIGSEILEKKDFIQDNISIEFSNNPQGLNRTGAETLQGYEPLFLVIRADRMVSANPGPFATIYHFEKETDYPVGHFNSFINTQNPVGNESLITPKFNFIWQEPKIEKIGITDIFYQPQKIPEQTTIYVNYQASSQTHVGIYFDVEGSNYWNEGLDEWKMNTYRDDFSKTFSGGSQTGWYFVDGNLELLYGIYPNTTNPEWQQALNQPPPY
jgi:hypothetical protein